MIDASTGLGEAVVSGVVNPDHFVVNTMTGEIIERCVGDKRLIVQALPDGGTKQIGRSEANVDACLSDEQIRALAILGTRAEAHYDAPQDIE